LPIFLNQLTSVTSTSDGGHSQGYTYFRMRGKDQTRINMTLNGVPLNEPEDLGFYSSNIPMFLSTVKSFQIQRGVGTSTNGTSSFVGSINFETDNGLNKKSVLEMGYGSWNTKRIGYSYGSGMTKKGFSFFGNISAYGTNGYKYHSGGSGYSGFFSANYFTKKDKFSLNVSSGASLNDMAWLAVSERDLERDQRINYNSKGDRDNFKQTHIQFHHLRVVNNKIKIKNTLFYNRLDGNWDLNLQSVSADTGKLNFGLNSNFYGFINNINYNFKNVNLDFGTNVNLYNREHSMSIYPNLKELFYENVGKKYEYSSYLKTSYKFWKINIFSDFQYRYAHFAYVGDVQMENFNWHFFNPKSGISYVHNKKLDLYFTVGVSKREPTRTDLFGGEDNLIELTSVIPESVLDYELGVNYRGDKFNMSSNLYYMNFKNEIVLQGALGFNGLPLMDNVSRSFRSGLEVDFNYKITKNLNITNNFSYSYSKMKYESVNLNHILTPDFILNSQVSYSYKKIKLGLNSKAQSKSFLDLENKFYAPAFIVIGSSFEYNLKDVTFILNTTNLTNRKYYTGGYVVENERYFFVNESRSFYLTIRFKI
jgi:iron complex outermembrane receptor protein